MLPDRPWRGARAYGPSLARAGSHRRGECGKPHDAAELFVYDAITTGRRWSESRLTIA